MNLTREENKKMPEIKIIKLTKEPARREQEIQVSRLYLALAISVPPYKECKDKNKHENTILQRTGSNGTRLFESYPT